MRAVILNNLGNAQLGLRQLEAAQASLEEALGIYRRLEHHAGEGAVLNNLGACWEARSERDKACLSYTQALVASAQADDRRGQAITEGHIRRLIEQSAAGDRSVEACRAAFGE
ncbi:MAG TPA: hypothetical protein VFM88_05035 [Vicinamibacteria bacterium]|nr:hypothetical protein [Vicinamibacteria bacterium]